jgi:hypothetical protein
MRIKKLQLRKNRTGGKETVEEMPNTSTGESLGFPHPPPEITGLLYAKYKNA